MEPGFTYHLLTDIKSAFHNQIYGTAGTEVFLIADHGAVMIVADKDDNRFPVPTDLLSDQLVVGQATSIIKEKPKTVRATKKKAGPIQQTNLFT